MTYRTSSGEWPGACEQNLTRVQVLERLADDMIHRQRTPGGIVSVIYPSDKIAARWAGALEARLKLAPLENFLRSRSQKWVLTGDARVSDNLASGTIYIVDGALNAFMLESRGTLTISQHPVVGQMACAVGHGLATLIKDPNAWRIAALVATARVLSPYSGLDAAAHIAAAAARDHSTTLNAGTQQADVVQIGNAAAAAVESNDEERVLHVMKLILRRLSGTATGILTQSRPPSLAYDLGASTSNSSGT